MRIFTGTIRKLSAQEKSCIETTNGFNRYEWVVDAEFVYEDGDEFSLKRVSVKSGFLLRGSVPLQVSPRSVFSNTKPDLASVIYQYLYSNHCFNRSSCTMGEANDFICEAMRWEVKRERNYLKKALLYLNQKIFRLSTNIDLFGSFKKRWSFQKGNREDYIYDFINSRDSIEFEIFSEFAEIL